MPIFRQTLALVHKNLKIIVSRHWLSTLIRAFLFPIIFTFFIGYAKNLFVPPSDFGIGTASPLLTFREAVARSDGGRRDLPFVSNGLQGAEGIISNLSSIARAEGLNPIRLDNDNDLLTTCQSSIRGVSNCFAALSFRSTPSDGGSWNYTIRADGALGIRIYVNARNSDAEIYVLPLQHAVDAAIAREQGISLPNPSSYPYTSQTAEERARAITRAYMGTLISILAIAYFIAVVPVCYHLAGLIATEREQKMTQLIDAMMPNRRRWQPQALRILAYHLSFDLTYLPGWLILGGIMSGLNYPQSSYAITIIFVLLSGLALSSWSIAFAALFKKAQLSGVTVTIVSIVLAIIVQVQTPDSTVGVVITSIIFPPINYIMFIIYMAYWQRQTLPANISQPCPDAPWRVPGYAFFLIAILQILVYPIIGAWLERLLHGTSSKARVMTNGQSTDAVRIQGLSKIYKSAWSPKRKQPVKALDSLDLVIRQGELSVLLGANGSGKSTTNDLLAGLQAPSAGEIYINSSSVGLCPQANVLFSDLTCMEHVTIFNRLKARKTATKQGNRDLLISCDLEHKLNAQAKTLSGGQKRKLQLACMLTGDSEVCMVDEVSSGIDPLSRQKIWKILLAERGRRSILLTTHMLDEADLLSDHITILSKGRLVAGGSSVELKDQHGGGYKVKIYKTNTPEKLAWADFPITDHVDHTVYIVGDSAAAALFVEQLEQHGIHDYRVLGPTIEDAFLKLAASDEPAVSPTSKDDLVLENGRRISFFKQTWVLFRKRWTVLQKNYLPHVFAVLIPIAAAGLVTLFVKNQDKISCTPAETVREASSFSLGYYASELDIPIGPAGQIPEQAIQLLDSIGSLDASPFRTVASTTDLNRYIRANYSEVRPGGFFVDHVGAVTTPVTGATFGWQGNYGLSFAVLTQNLLDSSIIGTPIQTAYQPFDLPFAPGAGQTLQFVLYFGLAMCVFPGFLALYPTMERRNNVRALHWSNGVRPLPLWLAYAMFDFIFVLLISAVSVIIFAASTSSMYFVSWLFLVFFLYGLTATLLAFCFSLVVKSQLAAFASTAGYLCATFLIHFVAYTCIQAYVNPAYIDRSVTIAHFTIALISPSASLLRTLLVTFNEFSILCDGFQPRSYAGDILVFGGPILYFIWQALLMLGILLWVDSGWRPALFRRNKTAHLEDSDVLADEVRQEKIRVDGSDDPLRVQHITKTFGEDTAVDDLCFGVARGEVFGLLGPNGAGKSTTLSMIRGEIAQTGSTGDILIEGTSVVKHRAAARTNLGVCPQFDCLDLKMTAIDHLRFYARARGIRDVETNVQKIIDAVGIRPFKDRYAGKLSGGNKRKLSLGIALMGNPSVLIVDEGSSGMDASAQRVMWRTLQAVSADRSLVITSHNMEEIDALAHRVGIMAKRMLALGTTDFLRQKHGDAYYVHVVHEDAPATSPAAMDTIKAWIRAEFPAADVEDRSFHGQIRFSVPVHSSGVSSSAPSTEKLPLDGSSEVQTVSEKSVPATKSIAMLFASLEANKERLGLRFYSVAQTTLDQCFLNIVSRHQIEEEGHERATRTRRVGVWTYVKRQARRVFSNA